MRVLLRSAKWGGLALALVLGCAVLAYAGLLIVNRADEPSSAIATSFAGVLDRSSSDLRADDNALVYAAGLDAPRGADPRALGLRWLEWTRLPLSERSLENEPVGESLDGLPGIGESGLKQWTQICRTADERCLDRLKDETRELADGLAEAKWLLRRYGQLLQYTDWREPAPDFLYVFPYGAVSTLNELYGLSAWRLARGGEVQHALVRLGEEARFWRTVLESTNTVTGKAITAMLLQRNLYWTNAVLRAVQTQKTQRSAQVPTAWKKPLKPSERSMRRAFAGELHVSRKIFAPDFPVNEDIPLLEYLSWQAQRPLLQPQATINRMAARYDRLDRALSVPYAALDAELEALREKFEREATESVWFRLYNPVGYSLFRVGAGVDQTYFALRVADLEGARRAVLLAAKLRADGVAARDVAPRLTAATIRNPYTEEAFGWNSEAEAITFQGLSVGGDGNAALPY